MNERIEYILELPPQHRISILLGTMVLIALAYWFAFYSAISTELTNLNKAIEGKEGLKVKVAVQKEIASHLEEYRLAVKDLDIELKKALSQLPDSKEIPNLLAKISDTARDAGLEVRLFKPDAEVKHDFYASIPVQIEVGGTYHEVTTFFDDVAHFERIVNLDGINMVDPQVGEDSVTLKTSIVATAFRFLDESERPKEDDEATKGKRRRGAKPGAVKKLS